MHEMKEEEASLEQTKACVVSVRKFKKVASVIKEGIIRNCVLACGCDLF